MKQTSHIQDNEPRPPVGWKRWPKFWGLIFCPGTMAAVGSGGLISESEERPAEAIKMDLEYLLDLFNLINLERRLKSFWSATHRAWVFYSEEKIENLGFGARSLCAHVLRKFRKKDAFYEEIFAHSQAV